MGFGDCFVTVIKAHFVLKGEHAAMENIKGLVKCRACGESFEISAANVYKKRVLSKSALAAARCEVWVIYYDCPKCGTRHCVQVDNVVSNRLLEEQIKTMRAVLRCKKQGKQVPRKLANKYNRASSDLTKIRKFLANAFNNAQAVDPDSGELFPIVFCASSLSAVDDKPGDGFVS